MVKAFSRDILLNLCSRGCCHTGGRVFACRTSRTARVGVYRRFHGNCRRRCIHLPARTFCPKERLAAPQNHWPQGRTPPQLDRFEPDEGAHHVPPHTGPPLPHFCACGWFKIPLGRFTLLSVITGGVYTSIALTLVIVFGDLVLVHLNYWAWILVAIIVIVFASTSLLKPKFAKVTEQALNDSETPSFLKMLKTYKPGRKNRHTGMPSPEGLKKLVSLAERLPNGLFYLPVGLRWLFLSARYRSLTLPTVSNPMIEPVVSGASRKAISCSRWATSTSNGWPSSLPSNETARAWSPTCRPRFR